MQLISLNYEGDTGQPSTHFCVLSLDVWAVTATLRNNLHMLFPGDLELFCCILIWLE